MFLFNRLSQFRYPIIRHVYRQFSSSTKKVQDSNFNLIVERLKINVQKSQQLEKKLIQASLGQSTVHINKEKTRMQINKMAPMVALYEQIAANIKNIADLKEMKKQAKDQEEKNMINQEIAALGKKQQQYKQQSIKLLIPPDLYDDWSDVNLEFRSGAGGSQSCLFVEEFSNMIFGYCDSMGWKTQILSALKDGNINRGYRSLVAKVVGQQAYKYLKCQSGVHKVIRIPQTQAKGRIHSSTISMVVMPTVPFDFTVNDRDIRYQYMRSSGPGGQSVNKTESACRATHIPTGLSVMNQQDKSQDKNRKRATQILKQKLFQIQYKKNVEDETKRRKSQIGTMDRSQKIRTYNYPQDRITDHRTGLTLFGMQQMMAGQYLDKFITAYQQKVYEQKLQMLLQDLRKPQKQ